MPSVTPHSLIYLPEVPDCDNYNRTMIDYTTLILHLTDVQIGLFWCMHNYFSIYRDELGICDGSKTRVVAIIYEKYGPWALVSYDFIDIGYIHKHSLFLFRP